MRTRQAAKLFEDNRFVLSPHQTRMTTTTRQLQLRKNHCLHELDGFPTDCALFLYRFDKGLPSFQPINEMTHTRLEEWDEWMGEEVGKELFVVSCRQQSLIEANASAIALVWNTAEDNCSFDRFVGLETTINDVVEGFTGDSPSIVVLWAKDMSVIHVDVDVDVEGDESMASEIGSICCANDWIFLVDESRVSAFVDQLREAVKSHVMRSNQEALINNMELMKRIEVLEEELRMAKEQVEELEEERRVLDCCVCLESFAEKETILLTCKHLIHAACFQNIDENEPRCPMCRRDVAVLEYVQF
eukprot:TRINITY_DN1610_c0_g1_i5.p1 TRINITY_DN1610_c0_g1~~TRINITY_DN1610_c0_g1_i5.p1  ORF type:complete len:302 (-),score=88.59 TRINITY_DN1610_c0_g1_i5:260-1165(-)